MENSSLGIPGGVLFIIVGLLVIVGRKKLAKGLAEYYSKLYQEKEDVKQHVIGYFVFGIVSILFGILVISGIIR